jgi:hypothetical protein
MIAHLIKTACLIVATTFFLNCTNAESPIESEPESPRIILGESIEGVSIGDDSLSVIARLGRPTTILEGDFNGHIFVYDKGKHALTYVSISREPALGFGVISVRVEPPYQGITKDGIGIGSEHNFVISKIGQPDKISEGASIVDKYFYQKNNFGFVYYNERVHSIIMIIPYRE